MAGAAWHYVLVGALALAPTPPPRGVARRPFLATSLALGTVPALSSPIAFASELPPQTCATIAAGRAAVLPGWLPKAEVAALCADAKRLHAAGHFTADALASYEPAKRGGAASAASHSREVLPAFFPSTQRAGPWADATLGDSAARLRFGARIHSLRAALAAELGRPGLALAADDRPDSRAGGLGGVAAALREVSYTRFGPGASLRRHVDEHAEALKGSAGWRSPTRRSVSWLVYLQGDDWDVARDGGALRTFPRCAPPGSAVGALDGDLQVGWLRASAADPVERAVFLDSNRPGPDGDCALYTATALSAGGGGVRREWLTPSFHAQPLLYQSQAFLVDKLLIRSPRAAGRFQFVEAPRAPAAELLGLGGARPDDGEAIVDVAPAGGTLVLFDSVALPHEVLPTLGRERWACSGWLREPQQPRVPRTA
jgi:hypothetical protein